MANEDETLWIVYNGEIFNHASLRPLLEAAGHRYRTHCDTETILHSFEQHGPASVEQFRAMFAFALWDKRHDDLINHATLLSDLNPDPDELRQVDLPGISA